ncbi:MAG: Na+/H+ antiporter [Actinomycetota bacterium]|nr:Na+/H+ antiporter [Actinomycetota bacterium]
MTPALTLLAIAAVVVMVATAARRVGASAPLLLTAVGAGLSFVPGIPEIEVGPEVILLGILPPLLYAAAIRSSLVDLGANKRVIGLLSVGLVVFTAFGVAFVVWRLLDVPFAAALALGGIVAPPDAVAATTVARRIGLPRRIVTILEGESLFNDATALVTVRVAILGIAGAVSLVDVGVNFLRAALGGIAVGLAVAWVLARIRRALTDTTTDTALSFMAPWLAYLPAEVIHSSGVLAVVVCGILLGHKSPVIQSAQSRMAERLNWTTIQFLLENAVFLIIGLQVHLIVQGVVDSGFGLGPSVALAVVVLVAVILLRAVWVLSFGAALSIGSGVGRGRYLRTGLILSWAGMRGVVTLAAAFLLPTDTPQRPTLVFIALVVTVGTLLIQGLSLPVLARALDVHGPDPREDALQSASVLQRAVAKGNEELDRLAGPDTPTEALEQLRLGGRRRTHLAWERLGVTHEEAPSPNEVYRRLRRGMLQAERAEVLRLRDSGTVDHEVLADVMRTLDLEESMLAGMESRADQLQERVILTPETQRGDCDHLRDARGVEPATPEGCVDCLREGLTWVNLRLCLTCGNVGCCDSSVGQHADRHYDATRHPVMRSFEPGEAWRWCYVDDLLG